MTADTLKPDTTLREYAIKRVLGRGAFGVTYLAERTTGHYAVAIKEYFPIDFADRDRDGTTVNPRIAGRRSGEFNTGLEKFLEESRILSGFRSPHIVRVVDTFELHGTAYMVMQYEEGGTLEQYLEAHPRPLDENEILSIFVPVLRGLKDIHAQWLLHRDIKPSNIYIRADGTPLLIDFGTARHVVTARKTGMTEYLTPGYAPPEQYDRHESHGPWTDIYAVGATMYHCVTRIKPPEGRTRLGGTDPLVPAVQAAPALYDGQLLELIDWMMKPEASGRPQNVDEVLRKLEEMRKAAPERGTERIAKTLKRESLEEHAAEQAERGPELPEPPAQTEPVSPRGERSRPWIWLAIAAVAVVVVGGAVVWQMKTPRQGGSVRDAERPTEKTKLSGAAQKEQANVRTQIDNLLSQCAAHVEADRLTSGAGGNALECYRSVLALDTGNAEALAGLKQIEDTYAQWARSGIESGNVDRARTNLDKLKGLNPEHRAIADLEAGIAALEKAQEARASRPAFEPEMVRVRGGCFQMGSPASESGRDDNERQHRVCVEDFSIGKYEVTVDQFRQFVEATGYETEAEASGKGCYTYESGEWKLQSGTTWHNPGFMQGTEHPVVCVSWNDAHQYVRWISERAGKDYRLPTEAEWEYAERAGSGDARYWGSDPDRACRFANVHDRKSKEVNGFSWEHHECDDGYAQTAPVGRFDANGYGLHDVLGNVWEWTCSTYNESYDGGETRCVSKGADGARVLRGGSWNDGPWSVRSAYRYWDDPGLRTFYVGFRLAQD